MAKFDQILDKVWAGIGAEVGGGTGGRIAHFQGVVFNFGDVVAKRPIRWVNYSVDKEGIALPISGGAELSLIMALNFRDRADFEGHPIKSSGYKFGCSMKILRFKDEFPGFESNFSEIIELKNILNTRSKLEKFHKICSYFLSGAEMREAEILTWPFASAACEANIYKDIGFVKTEYGGTLS